MLVYMAWTFFEGIVSPEAGLRIILTPPEIRTSK